jgi:hypothetical protein
MPRRGEGAIPDIESRKEGGRGGNGGRSKGPIVLGVGCFWFGSGSKLVYNSM